MEITMELDNRQFPSGVSKNKTTVKIEKPNAQVAFSTERSTLHHDGKHVGVQGPATVTGRGKASEVGSIMKSIKESSRGR